MQEEFLFGLLAPAIALLISMNFFVFWSRQPEARHILAFGMSFSLGAISMSLSHNLIAGLSYANVFTAILFDTASLSLLLWGSCERVKMKTPYFLIATTFAIALLAGYGMTKHLDVAALRLIPVNSLHATLLFTCGWVWRKGRDSEHVANRGAVSVIFFSFALFSIAFPFVMYNVPGTPLADQYQHSTSWFIYNFAIIMMVMIGGLTLTAVLADDMVKKIKIVSNTDLLTGLKTRRAFEEEFEDIFIKLERSPLPLSIIIADIDHFKLVNDTYGHQTGDRVIATFGKLIAEGSRKTDLVARIGGEEFCIVLWNADASGARLVAENLRTQFQAAQFEGIPKHKKFTSSFGVATLKAGEVSEELYRRADQALYFAKQEGRNRVCLDQTHLEPDDHVEKASTNIVLYPSA